MFVAAGRTVLPRFLVHALMYETAHFSCRTIGFVYKSMHRVTWGQVHAPPSEKRCTIICIGFLGHFCPITGHFGPKNEFFIFWAQNRPELCKIARKSKIKMTKELDFEIRIWPNLRLLYSSMHLYT